MAIKVISFDVDGTLFNTDEIYFKYLQKILHNIGFDIDRVFYAQHGYDDCIYSLSLSNKNIILVKQKMGEFYYSDKILKYVRMRRGVLSALKRLSRIFYLAIGSGEEKSQILRYISHFSLTKFFTFIGHGALVHRRKSNPNYFLSIANYYKVKPNECLHIGDNLIDQQALNAGVFVAIIPTRYSKDFSFDSRCHLLKNIGLLPRFLEQEFNIVVP